MRFVSYHFNLFVIFVLIFAACNHPKSKVVRMNGADEIISCNVELTKVIMSDIFTPPVASRIYAYCNIASYEALAKAHKEYQSLAGQLHDLKATPEPEKDKQYDFQISSCIAFSTAAKKLVFGKDKVEEFEKNYFKILNELDLSKEIIDNSVEYGRLVGEHIVEWASKDQYVQRQALPRYFLKEEEGMWQPTPPDYMAAIEPHWRTIRPLVLDSAAQFKPERPTRYDTAKNSQFYKETMEVYNTVNNLKGSELEIAKFWDCNPNISYTKGHVMLFHQKISPGGHWISIAGIASKTAKADAMKTCEAITLTSIALADGFISCWDEKYRSNVVRPVTFIQKYIDPDWTPLLQTPAFPEYPSGHSVISSAAATVLTSLFGENFTFQDSTEIIFGLPARTYHSFYEASDEAALSRLYGGIHYRPAIENGVKQGKNVGAFILNKINTRYNHIVARK